MATGGNFDPRRLEHTATIGGMIKHGTVVIATCRACGATKQASLDRLRQALGEDGSLIDRHPPCWRRKCGGEVVFHAHDRSSGTPARPLVTIAGEVARLRRQRAEVDRWKALRNG